MATRWERHENILNNLIFIFVHASNETLVVNKVKANPPALMSKGKKIANQKNNRASHPESAGL